MTLRHRPIDPLEPRRLMSALPAPWTDADIGTVGKAGSASVGGSTYTVSGGGADIWGNNDAFNFASQPMTGNGTIIARVTGETDTNGWAKAGLMIRESAAADSRHIALVLTPSHGASFQVRSATHLNPSYQTTPAATGEYLELVRSGSTFTGYVSTDDKSWTKVGSATVTLPNNVEVGLAVTAHDNTKLCTATFTNVSIVTTNTVASPWAVGPNDYLHRWESCTATVNNKVYVFGGYTDGALDATADTDVYNPSANTWSQLSPEPIPVTHAGTVAVGNSIILVGGYEGKQTSAYNMTAAVQVYDTTTNTWSTLPSLPTAIGAGGVACINNVLYFYGGSPTGRATDSDQTWALNINDTAAGWIAKADMPDARNHVGYTSLNGLAYAIGGLHLGNETTRQDAQVDVYNPVTNTWSQAASLPFPWSHFNDSTLAINGKIVIVGGQTNGAYDGVYLPNIEEYAPFTNKWTALPPLPEARQAVVAGWAGNELIAIDGAVDDQGGIPQEQVWYDNTFTV